MKLKYIIFLVLGVIFLAGCAEAVQVSPELLNQQRGFCSGFLHGVIVPFSFLFSLFDESVAIYAANNTGATYDLGFILGVAILLIAVIPKED